jgi:hypothetical protein
MNLIVDNYPIKSLAPFLLPLKNTIHYPSIEQKNNLYSVINSDKDLYKTLKMDVFSEDTVLEKMEKLRTLNKTTPEYSSLYQDIISVGEFEIGTDSRIKYS